MVCHGSHQYIPFMLALIYQHHGSYGLTMNMTRIMTPGDWPMDHLATFAASEISNISRINAEVWAQKAGCATWRGDIWCPIWEWLETGFSQGIPKSTAKTHQFFLKIPWLRGTPICIILHLEPFVVSMVATDFFTAQFCRWVTRRAEPSTKQDALILWLWFPNCHMWNTVVDHKICGIPMKSWGKYVQFLCNPEENMWNSYEILYEIWCLRFPEAPLSHQWIRWSWSAQDSSAASILPPSCAWVPASEAPSVTGSCRWFFASEMTWLSDGMMWLGNEEVLKFETSKRSKSTKTPPIWWCCSIFLAMWIPFSAEKKHEKPTSRHSPILLPMWVITSNVPYFSRPFRQPLRSAI